MLDLVSFPMVITVLVSPVCWYGVDSPMWMGKNFCLSHECCFYSGWFWALLESDWIRREIQKLKVRESKITMAMGTHPRLGEASIFRVLAGVPEILGLIERKL